MSWLVSIALTNAALATLLALVALAVCRLVRSPALTHLLWVIVLLKLFTPPLIQIPVGWKLALLPVRWAANSTLAANSTDHLPMPASKSVVVDSSSHLPSPPAP